jgi:hypothetical protein
MTASALRIIIEQDLLPAPMRERAPQDLDSLLSIVTDYVVSGWLGLLSTPWADPKAQ